MSERSIPEILGWEPAPEWLYVDRHFQHPTAGYDVNEHGGWTVDDLLAWLASDQVTSVAVSIYGRPDSESRAFVTVRRKAEDTSIHAPTLLEALEAAVRAIDAEAPGERKA